MKGQNKMANMFASLAKRATTLSPLMEGREKLSTDAVIKQYPNGITITEFDVITTPDKNGNPSTYPVIAFAEDTQKFIYGGKALMDIVTMWLANFDGDVETTSKALKSAGGVKVKMTSDRTKQGNNFTRIDVIG